MERFPILHWRGGVPIATIMLFAWVAVASAPSAQAAEGPGSRASVHATATPLSSNASRTPLALGDQIYVISTRGIGLRCEPSEMPQGLQCETQIGGAGMGHWQPLAWHDLTAALAAPLPTVIYIHGNRVDHCYAKSHGLAMYRSLAARRNGDDPIRFIILSWPSSQIQGQLRDYQVKAARTRQVAWQLAWTIDQMPAETPLAVIGYSYGARVATGALHLLAGGRLGPLELADRNFPQRPPVRAALVAAAVDANWIRPGGYHGRALEQVDQLLLVNNHLDPAMRFYHLAMESGARPLGYGGVGGLGPFADRVRAVDVTGAVGRHHAIEEYLASSGRVSQALQQVASMSRRPEQTPSAGDAELAGHP